MSTKPISNLKCYLPISQYLSTFGPNGADRARWSRRVVEKLANDYEGVVKFAKVDVDQNPGLSGTYGVRSIPTLLIFRGGNPVEQIVGAVPESVLKDKLQGVLQMTA